MTLIRFESTLSAAQKLTASATTAIMGCRLVQWAVKKLEIDSQKIVHADSRNIAAKGSSCSFTGSRSCSVSAKKKEIVFSFRRAPAPKILVTAGRLIEIELPAFEPRSPRIHTSMLRGAGFMRSRDVRVTRRPWRPDILAQLVVFQASSCFHFHTASSGRTKIQQSSR
ncbi:hypothetical protein PVAP13_9KG637450 [Panicum virgatum]|uniref:Uncharacterized protein n=1 Tax=Panicum virgatum TaxID=38727 RepID=A0A8T0P5S2_PANVG|nr:hypothetical protein PVAP13_9KG637450 [Panicum virgatum]